MSVAHWDKIYAQNGGFRLKHHEMLTRVINLFKENAISKVVDLGCGDGSDILAFAEAGFEVLGIDFSPLAVDIAQKRLQEKGFSGRAAVADLHLEVPAMEAGSFGGCLAINSLHYKTEADFTKVLHEIRRILQEKGLLFLVVPSSRSKDRQGMSFSEKSLRKEVSKHFEILDFDTDTAGNFALSARRLS
jgi:SAM-dependent methyltransferase